MALKPLGQLDSITLDYITVNTSERGGVLSYGSVSGILIAEYARDPASAVPIGIQNNDVEHMDLSRQVHPRELGRRVDGPFSTVGIITEADVVTDWLQLSGVVMPGQPAYVGHSGTITNCRDYGGTRIGTFLSILKAEPHYVVFAGLGFSREYMDPYTKALMMENDPAHRILVVTPGFAKVRVSQAYIAGKAG
jgi:hypothetical protein